jgi:hypothetical protein
MENQPHPGTSSSEHTIWIWIITGALIVLAALIGVGALALMNATQQQQLPTGSQTVPSTR